MKKLIFPIVLSSLALSWSACQSEDTPEAIHENPSEYFSPKAEDQSEEALLRREFKTETGCYLLFNDTLRHNLLGTDINGDPQYFTETIDFGYDIGQSSASSATYKFTYLTTIDEKRQMVDFLKTYILRRLSNKMHPYSILLANVITGTDVNMGSVVRPYALANQRCFGIAANYLLQRPRTEAQKQAYAARLLVVTVNQQAANNPAAFESFYAYSSRYYSQSLSAYGMTASVETFRNAGFINASSSNFPSAVPDLSAYVSETLQNTAEELQAKYGQYPVVMAKFAEVRRSLTALGYVFGI